MKIKEIAELWLGSPFLEKYRGKGEEISREIEALKRAEKMKAEMKERLKK